jgi:hypothetical protein
MEASVGKKHAAPSRQALWGQSAGLVGRDARTAYGLKRLLIIGAQASNGDAKIARPWLTRN